MLVILSSCFWKLFTLALELLVVEFEGDALDTVVIAVLVVTAVVEVESGSPCTTGSFAISSLSLLLTWASLLLLSSFPLVSLSVVSLLLPLESDDSFSLDRDSLDLLESVLSSPLLSPFD